MTEKQALEAAIAALGNASRLAEALGIRPEAVYQWDRCPAPRVLSVERLTGISRYDLRPDIFGEKPGAKEKADA